MSTYFFSFSSSSMPLISSGNNSLSTLSVSKRLRCFFFFLFLFSCSCSDIESTTMEHCRKTNKSILVQLQLFRNVYAPSFLVLGKVLSCVFVIGNELLCLGDGGIEGTGL